MRHDAAGRIIDWIARHVQQAPPPLAQPQGAAQASSQGTGG